MVQYERCWYDRISSVSEQSPAEGLSSIPGCNRISSDFSVWELLILHIFNYWTLFWKRRLLSRAYGSSHPLAWNIYCRTCFHSFATLPVNANISYPTPIFFHWLRSLHTLFKSIILTSTRDRNLIVIQGKQCFFFQMKMEGISAEDCTSKIKSSKYLEMGIKNESQICAESKTSFVKCRVRRTTKKTIAMYVK